MKKILVISYFAPPSTFTAAQRIQGWIDNFQHYGYIPVVITRNWNIQIRNIADANRPSGNKTEQVSKDNSQLIYVPYYGNLRDKLTHTQHPNFFTRVTGKIMTAMELIFQNWINAIIPSIALYKYARTYLQQNKDVKAIIISGNPFIQFRFGYLLHLEFDIPWIADYRDDWTTTELFKPDSLIKKIIFYLERKSEQKWVGTAAAITSISSYYVKKISDLTGVKGVVVQNGFDDQLFLESGNELTSEVFRIVYNGTLYASQSAEIFLEAVKMVIHKYSGILKMEICFPGLGMVKMQEERVLQYMKGYEQFLKVSERIDKESIIDLQKKANMVVMIAHAGIKGIPSSKLYEYLALRKFILLCPGDKDVLDETISYCDAGSIANTIEEAFQIISEQIEHFMQTHKILPHGIPERIQEFSKKNQVAVLAHQLDKIIV